VSDAMEMATTVDADIGADVAWAANADTGLVGRSARRGVRPIIKWAGGKWRLAPTLRRFMPPVERIRRYYEPFVGGAALFFHLQPADAQLSDTNPELINLYTVVRDQLPALLDALRGHVNESAYYYRVREQDPATLGDIERAARLIYLNKTCYNGLYRVNARGAFNVPFGRFSNPAICDAANLALANAALQGVALRLADYETALAKATAGDLIYFDPPYQPVSKTASFTSYTQTRFGPDEQARLAGMMATLAARGCYVTQSNSDTPLIRDLYGALPGFILHTIQATRAINSKASARGPVNELVITNYASTAPAVGAR